MRPGVSVRAVRRVARRLTGPGPGSSGGNAWRGFGDETLRWRGSRPSWDEVVRTHSGRVYRLAYRLTGNQHDAEDLTQDVFVRVFRSLRPTRRARSRAGCTASPRTSSSTGSAASSGSASTRSPTTPRERLAASADAGPRPTTTPTSTTTSQRALDSLSPEFRAAVVLCDIEGLSYEEIAATLGVKLGTVRSRIHRGRAMLRAALAHRAPQGDRTRYAGPAPVATGVGTP